MSRCPSAWARTTCGLGIVGREQAAVAVAQLWEAEEAGEDVAAAYAELAAFAAGGGLSAVRRRPVASGLDVRGVHKGGSISLSCCGPDRKPGSSLSRLCEVAIRAGPSEGAQLPVRW